MKIDKSLQTGSTAMLLLKLLETRDLYGYEMIQELKRQSNDIFSLKAGTLYPLLHTLEEAGSVTSYEGRADSARMRKYYHLTEKGRQILKDKKQEWNAFTSAVNQVLNGAEAVFSYIGGERGEC